MLQKYLQAQVIMRRNKFTFDSLVHSQSIVWPFIITGFLTNVASAIFHAIFVIGADLGVK